MKRFGLLQRKLYFRCILVFLLSLLIICLLKTYRSGPEELYEINSNASVLTHKKYNVDCTHVYQLEPVEVGKSLEIRRKKPVDLQDDDVTSLTSDCERYKYLRGYESIPVSDKERQFPIAYSLVVHKHAAMVERILRSIYMPQNVYCLHYDKKSSKGFVAAMENLARCFPNVFVASKLESVYYAHITRLRADLNCLSDLLTSPVQWRYVINLCGQDLPLRSNYELVEELKKLQGKNMLESSRPTPLKKQRFEFHHELKKAAFEYQQLPVRSKKAKSKPPHEIQMFVGSAYFVLSREFVSHMQESKIARDFLSWCSDTYSPDEHFWATLTRVPGVPGEIPRKNPDVTDLMSKTRLVKWSYLEGTLYPPCTGTYQRSVCIYGAGELHWLLNYGHWFANKFDPHVDPVLVQCLEVMLEEKQHHWVEMDSQGQKWRWR